MTPPRGSCSALLLLFLAMLSSTVGESSVHVRSKYGQLVTSSTLQWIDGSGGKKVEYAVVGAHHNTPVENDENDDAKVTQRPVYVCRARHNGVYVSGELKPNDTKCAVSLVGVVANYPKYQILVNYDEAARLAWIAWDKFKPIPTGAVAGGETYVARKKQENPTEIGYTYRIGKLDPNDSFGKISIINEASEEQEYDNGEILVETEPVRYELTGIKFNLWRKRVSSNETILTEYVLRNGAGTVPMNVDTVLTYDSEYLMYWGQAKNTLKGLPTTVRLANGTIINEIKWGLQENETRKDVFSVGYWLEPGTAVNVTLVGNNTDSEIPYSGKLVAVYEDGQHKGRPIAGSRREVAMLNVHTRIGPVFYINNNTLVPTTTTTTTTTTSTTTTTTTTTTTEVPPHHELDGDKKKPDDMFSNDITKGENQSMLKDGDPDGNEAMSLKNGVSGAKHQEREVEAKGMPSSATSSMSALVPLIFFAIVHRIT